MKYFLPLTLSLCFLTGCTAAMQDSVRASMRYSAFTGYKEWPHQRGVMADHAYAVPVYHGWPEREYRVIGSIQFANDYHIEWKDGDTAHAARVAKQEGGDAMIMRSGGEFGVGGNHGHRGRSFGGALVRYQRVGDQMEVATGN